MKTNLLAISVSTLAAFFAIQASAQMEPLDQTSSSLFPALGPVQVPGGYRPSIGIKAGVANPEGSYSSAAEFGLDVGFQPYVPFGIGATITTSRNSSQTTALDLERTSILARGTYNLGGTTPVLKNSWVGVAAGPVFRRDGTDLGLAPIVGFDIPMHDGPGSYFSLGADAKYLALINSNDSDSLSVNGVVKYWF
jgi:hypothetical protein